MWGKAICTTKHNEPIILHQTASYLAVDVELRLNLLFKFSFGSRMVKRQED